MHSTISEKGQVTVPKPLRERLGLRPGDRIEFSEERRQIVLSKAHPVDPVTAAYGVLKLERSVDETLRELRGDLQAP